MDQAIAFLAVKGCAQFIEWNPLTATPTSLPPNAFFVIANSLSKANKAATSDFNQRVIECRLACRFIAKKLNLDWRNLERFASLQKAINCDLNEFERIADSHLTAEIYSRQELIAALEVTEEEFENDLLTPNTRHAEKFKLRQRALHVIQGKRSSEHSLSNQNFQFIILKMHLLHRINSSASVSKSGRAE